MLGVFTSVDPVLGVGGSTGWNGYLYANANPTNLTDPSGACIGPLTFLLPVCIEAGKLLVAGIATATIVGGAAFVNDVRGQVWYNQTQAGLSFIDSFQHLNVAGLIDSTLKGAEFGFNLGTGFGAGALAQKFGFAGAKAIAAGLASDVILGASWDVAAHGDNFLAAVAGNTLGFFGGELGGKFLQKGLRFAQRGLKAADNLLLRAGRWYNNTFDRYAMSAGGLPIPTLNEAHPLPYRLGQSLPDSEIIVIGSNNTPGNFVLRPGVDDLPLGDVTAPGKSGSIAIDLNIRTEYTQMFRADREWSRSDILSGAFVEDIRAAGFDVIYAPTLRNPRHVRIVAGTNAFDEVGRHWLSLAFDRVEKFRR